MRNVRKIFRIKVKHRFLNYSFFFTTITEWNDLDYSQRNAPSINIFKQNILEFICHSPSNVFTIYNPHGPKLLRRLRLGLSHLQGHNFKHNRCFLFLKGRHTRMNKIRDIDSSFIGQNENSVCYKLLFDKYEHE